jgi:prolyl 4-hydroxylase
MHSSSSASSRSSSSSSSGSSFSAFTLVQYAFFGLVAYVLAGAPLRNILFSTDRGESYSFARDAGAGSMSPQRLDSLVIPDASLTCDAHAFKSVHVLSREPLVVYIEGFLGEKEADEVVELRYVIFCLCSIACLDRVCSITYLNPLHSVLLDISFSTRPPAVQTCLILSSNPLFQPSTIWSSGEERLDTSIRHSSKAPVPRSQTVRCIESRARDFQGWRPFVFVEKLWAQHYGPNGHYTYHYDWSSASRRQGRISSFMVWLGSECTGGGTHFPRIKRPEGKEWCRFVECGDEGDEGMEGVVFKPMKGNAVYWENIRTDGMGYEESWHAGLPVLSGEKIGLNIWSWYQDGYVPPKEQEQGNGADREV